MALVEQYKTRMIHPGALYLQLLLSKEGVTLTLL